ncbi:uncharacterized protein LOC121996622 [Zingiber officinale]|uniref:uncharacterized protein LOC121996622 n=1 Tax=Zingiber officinale TaxID=94328 RepID=UPI001C4CD395|nr:uncharacterized protein LOC121996622 [Zingiber officinale]XP_042406575.1 uncharacterized protein LOC121996622 [Zingiber officinale]
MEFQKLSDKAMGIFADFFWFIFTSSLIWAISFAGMHFLRPKKGSDSQSAIDLRRKDDEVNNEEEEEPPTLCFKFQYQFSDQQQQLIKQQAVDGETTPPPSANARIHNYSFLSGKDFTGFVEQPPAAKTYRVFQDSYRDPPDHASFSSLSLKDFPRRRRSSTDRRQGQIDAAGEKFPADKSTKSDSLRRTSSVSPKYFRRRRSSSVKADNFADEVDHGDIYIHPKFSGFNSEAESISDADSVKAESFVSSKASRKPYASNRANLSVEFGRVYRGRFMFNEFAGLDSDTESFSASDGYSVKELLVDSDSNGLFSDTDSSDDHEHKANSARYSGKFLEAIKRVEKLQSQLTHSYDAESVAANEEFSKQTMSKENEPDGKLVCDEKVMNQGPDESTGVQKCEESTPPNLNDKGEVNQNTRKGYDDTSSTGDTVSEASSGFDLSPHPLLETISRTDEELDGLEKELKKEKEVPLVDELDDDEYDELESLWEHEDLIEQLKIELKRVRAAGLPSISEESVAPKIVEDLKPWKIGKIQQEDPIEELHKFHKIYRGRMWKLDILNYQKMNTIGFLNLKDHVHSKGPQKSVIPAIKSVLLQNLWSCNFQMDVDPSDKLIKEVKNDLELVVVAQTCLSWEFLRWQYEKSRELPEFDHQYNHVADEFQQFQALLQRFIEDEPFQGPRLPNYLKSRSLVKNLLQVPVIREDTMKEKMEDESKGNFIVTIETLEDIMEESIRIFWEFVKADKDETPGFLKMLIGSHAELEDLADSKLMSEIQIKLEKKEKRLKDILRTGNCLVKKFKKPKEDRSNQDLFFSQVDLKLVARVLRMSKITTHQLVWCDAKLSNIWFVEAKVYREPSFLLFPC